MTNATRSTTTRVGPSRRRFLQGLAASGGAVAGAELLTACGTPPAVSPGGAPSTVDTSDADMELVFSNWPLYIDVDDDDENVRPTLDAFTEKTGVKVTYDESINDNDQYYAKITPQLTTGQPIGTDLFVVT
jgi:spermidine/putrescine transport system substrate-binding protein